MSGPRALETLLEVGRGSGPRPFDWQLRTRIVFGCDTIDRLGELAAGLGTRRALVVSDPGIVAAGHTGRGIESLARAGLATCLFDGSRENPTTEQVALGVEVAREFGPDLLVGLGGGSSLDCAKGINFIFSCGGELKDYQGVDRATGPMLPMIGVPTTAGTGSELQSFALISDPQTHMKMACGDRRASCAIAILDPRVTLTQPPQVTALTGVDAISHALETWVTRPRNPVSMMCSQQAWQMLGRGFPRVLEHPEDLDARGSVLLGAAWAGLAIENSMLGAAHSLANPLTARYDIPHGQAVGVMLPAVIRYNGEEFGDWYTSLGSGVPGLPAGTEGLASFVENILGLAGLQTSLAGLNVRSEELPELAASAARQWTARFNPRPVDAAALEMLYRSAL